MIRHNWAPLEQSGYETFEMINELHTSNDLFDEQDQAERPSQFAMILRLLRGRWHWVILFSLLLGGGGGYLGYNIQRDLYQGASSVELKPNYNLPVNVEDPTLSEPYQTFILGETRRLRSWEVIESAMTQTEWQEAIAKRPAGLPEITVGSFADNLDITEPARYETIMTVEYFDEDPDTARAGVNALLTTYRGVQQQAKNQQLDDNLKLLQDQLNALEQEKTSTESQIKLFVSGEEMLTIRSRLNAKLGELANMEFKLSEIDLRIKPYLDSLANADSGQQRLAEDPEMEALEIQRIELEDMYTFLTVDKGRGELMPDVVSVRQQLTMVNRKIAQLQADRAAAADGTINTDTMPPVVRDLMATREVILQKIEKLTAETTDMAGRIAAVEDYELKLSDLRGDIRDTNDKINKYRESIGLSQNEQVSRIVIGPPASTPTKPSNTVKRIQFACLGGIGGVVVGLGLVMLMGLTDSRVRHASDAVLGTPEVNVLGILPTLPADLSDPDDAETAAHCVHHIRTLMQIGGNNRVFSITSPAAGSGKSSLATALGMSFAASGARTLVIDADLVGAGLSRRMGTVVHDALESVIRRHEMLDEAHLARSLTLATAQNESLDEVLLSEGLMEPDQLDTAIRLQRDTSLGLLDACVPNRLRACVASTEIPNLFVLPVGLATPSDAGKLSPAAMRELIHQGREAFDIVLIDTGPVLGSIEASIAAAESDATVMIVSRGDQKTLTTRSLAQLRSVRAQVAGLVFNHALDRDLDLASYASLTSQERRPDRGSRKKSLDKMRSARLGPLGTAVASTIDETTAPANGAYAQAGSNGQDA